MNERRAAAQTLVANVSSAYDSSSASRRRGSLGVNVANEQKPEREVPKASKDDIATKKRIRLSNLLGDLRHYLVAEIVDSQMVMKLVEILEELLPAVQNQGEKVSSLG
jgi:ssDNA-binding replication factor A large subunit